MVEPISQIVKKIPFWGNLSLEEKALVSQRAMIKHFNKDQIVSSNSSACLGIILILSGGIRVSLISDEGREVTLYRAHANEFCVSTASCVIHQLTFETIVTAEEDTLSSWTRTFTCVHSFLNVKRNAIHRRFGPFSRCYSSVSTNALPIT